MSLRMFCGALELQGCLVAVAFSFSDIRYIGGVVFPLHWWSRFTDTCDIEMVSYLPISARQAPVLLPNEKMAVGFFDCACASKRAIHQSLYGFGTIQRYYYVNARASAQYTALSGMYSVACTCRFSLVPTVSNSCMSSSHLFIEPCIITRY